VTVPALTLRVYAPSSPGAGSALSRVAGGGSDGDTIESASFLGWLACLFGGCGTDDAKKCPPCVCDASDSRSCMLDSYSCKCDPGTPPDCNESYDCYDMRGRKTEKP